MIAANIGKLFLTAYNEKYKSIYNAKSFFVEKYFPLFFDNEKYMQWITNSPFVQGVKKGKSFSQQEREQKLAILLEKVSTQNADASIAIGYPSLDFNATTSGQVSNVTLPLDEEDVYYSWIGGGLGIGVQGGLSILFNKGQILLDIFEGWAIYRNYLDKMEKLRGNQINTWNGQWIAHKYNTRKYDINDPTAMFDPFGNMKDGGLEVNTQSWTSIIFGICRTNPESQIIGYVYNLGQTNTTIGFVPFRLPQIRRLPELYEKYFGTTQREEAEQLYGTAFGFTKACQRGAIGVNAMEPKGLKEYMDKGKIPVYNKDEEEKNINFKTYQIWLLAMLNNEQLWDYAQKFAATLHTYALSGEKAKKDKSNNVKELLKSVNKKQFIDSLTNIVDDSSSKEEFIEIAKLINIMPSDNVPYFLTLIRFQFATI